MDDVHKQKYAELNQSTPEGAGLENAQGEAAGNRVASRVYLILISLRAAGAAGWRLGGEALSVRPRRGGLGDKKPRQAGMKCTEACVGMPSGARMLGGRLGVHQRYGLVQQRTAGRRGGMRRGARPMKQQASNKFCDKCEGKS